MRMARGPREHGAGYTEIVMLPWRAIIDHAALSHLGLEGLELRISTTGLRSVNKTGPDQIAGRYGPLCRPA